MTSNGIFSNGHLMVLPKRLTKNAKIINTIPCWRKNEKLWQKSIVRKIYEDPMVQIKRVSNTHLPCSIPSGVARNPLGCLLIQLDLNVEYQKIELVIHFGRY